jgi:hypothetical protein
VVDRLIFADASPRGEQGIENSNRQLLVKQRPAGAPTVEDFEIADGPLPDPADGEVLVRAIYLSLDPYMRGRISAARSYAKPVDVGAVAEGRVVGHGILVFARAITFSADMGGSFTAPCPARLSSSWSRQRRRCRPRWESSGCRG